MLFERAHGTASPSSPGASSTVASAMPPRPPPGAPSFSATAPSSRDVVGEDEPAVAAQPPAVGQKPSAHRLAHGGAAEHHRLRHQQRGVLGEIDLDAAGKPRAVEQDRLLRQPGEPAAGGTSSRTSISASGPVER